MHQACHPGSTHLVFASWVAGLKISHFVARPRYGRRPGGREVHGNPARFRATHSTVRIEKNKMSATG